LQRGVGRRKGKGGFFRVDLCFVTAESPGWLERESAVRCYDRSRDSGSPGWLERESAVRCHDHSRDTGSPRMAWEGISSTMS
jgi:hypothetical protein